MFREWINNCNLINIGTSGPRFTWRGPVYHEGQRIYEKLDPALCNTNWQLEFPDAHVKILARVSFSDHHPLLIMLDNQYNQSRKHQFKFESARLLHDSYQEKLAMAWKDNISLKENLENVKELMIGALILSSRLCTKRKK